MVWGIRQNLKALFCALALLVFATSEVASAAVLFSEDFDGYTSFPSNNGKINPGLPELAEGADEYWYGGRFEEYDGGTVQQDVQVRSTGGNGNYTPIARVEDEAGILFKVNTVGSSSVTLDYDWRTASVSTVDRFTVGYYVGNDLGFDQGANRVREFFPDDYTHNEAVNWWNSDWTETSRGESSSWQHVSTTLPGGEEEVWVAFWLDNGEHDFGYVDNIVVEGDGSGSPSPPPAFLSNGSNTFVGNIIDGSIGHEADGSSVTPGIPGAWEQTMPGTHVFEIATDENFTFDGYDNDGDGEWSEGDTIEVMDQKLSISRNGQDVGFITFTDVQSNGTDLITLVDCPGCDGGPPSPPLGPSGSLDFIVEFTDTLTGSGLDFPYNAGYSLVGTLFIQPWDYTGIWNSFTSGNGLDIDSLYVWSSTEGPDGIYGTLYDELGNEVATDVAFGFDLAFNGSFVPPAVTIPDPIPEPSSALLALLGLFGFAFFGWRGRRSPARAA